MESHRRCRVLRSRGGCAGDGARGHGVHMCQGGPSLVKGHGGCRMLHGVRCGIRDGTRRRGVLGSKEVLVRTVGCKVTAGGRVVDKRSHGYRRRHGHVGRLWLRGKGLSNGVHDFVEDGAARWNVLTRGAMGTGLAFRSLSTCLHCHAVDTGRRLGGVAGSRALRVTKGSRTLDSPKYAGTLGTSLAAGTLSARLHGHAVGTGRGLRDVAGSRALCVTKGGRTLESPK